MAKRKPIRLIACALVLSLAIGMAFSLFGCTETPLMRIYVESGIPKRFSIDEELDVSKIILVGETLSGEKRGIPVEDAVVSGFDSGIVGKRKLTIRYNKLETEFEYEVIGNGVNSHARLNAFINDEGTFVLQFLPHTLDLALTRIDLTLNAELLVVDETHYEPRFRPHANFRVADRSENVNGTEKNYAIRLEIINNSSYLPTDGDAPLTILEIEDLHFLSTKVTATLWDNYSTPYTIPVFAGVPLDSH